MDIHQMDLNSSLTPLKLSHQMDIHQMDLNSSLTPLEICLPLHSSAHTASTNQVALSFRTKISPQLGNLLLQYPFNLSRPLGTPLLLASSVKNF